MPVAEFTASITGKTRPIPVQATNKEEIPKLTSDFLSDPEYQQLLHSTAEEATPVSPVTSMHRSQYQKMQDLCAKRFFNKDDEKMTLAPPSSDGRVNKVTVPGFHAPGLEVLTTSTQWIQVITRPDGLPELRLTVLDSTEAARGNRVLVWLFNKIMGKNKNKSEGESSPEFDKELFKKELSVLSDDTAPESLEFLDEDDSDDESPENSTTTSASANDDPTATKKQFVGTLVLQRIWPVISTVENRIEISFQYEVNASVSFKIAKTAVRLLPMSLEKFEYDGSKKVQKMLNRDYPINMDHLAEAAEVVWS